MKVKKRKNKITLKKTLKKNEKTKKVQKSIIGYEYSMYLAKLYRYRRNILVYLVAIILSIVFGYEIFKNSDRKKRNKNEGNDETNEKTSTNPIVSPITTVPPQNEKENDKDNQDTEPSIITAILSLLALLPPILNGGLEILRNSLGSIIQYALINYGFPIFSILAIVGFALTVLINATINNIPAQPVVLGILAGLASIVILLYLFKKFGNRLFLKGVQIIGNEGENEVINLNTESVLPGVKDLIATYVGENKNFSEFISSTIPGLDLYVKNMEKEEKRFKLKNKVEIQVNTERDINFQLTKGIIETLTIKSGETKNVIGNTLMQVSETLKNKGITNISPETMEVLTDYMKKTTGLADNSIKKVKAFIYLGSEINSLQEKINKLNDKEKQKLLANSDIKGLLKNIEEDNSITSDLKRDIIESINTKLIDESLKELNKSDSALIDINFQELASKLTLASTAMEKIFSNVKERLPEKESVEIVKNFLNESFNVTLDKGETAREAVKDNFKKAVDKAAEALSKYQASEAPRENIYLVSEQLSSVGRQFASLGNDILEYIQTYNESSGDLERYNLAADLVKKHYNQLVTLYGKEEVEEKIGRIGLTGRFYISPYFPENSKFDRPSLDVFKALLFQSENEINFQKLDTDVEGIEDFNYNFQFNQIEDGTILWGETPLGLRTSFFAPMRIQKERAAFIRDMNGKLWEEISDIREISDKRDNYQGEKNNKRTRSLERDIFKEKEGLDKFFIKSLDNNYEELKEIYPKTILEEYIGTKHWFSNKFSIADPVKIKKNSKESINEFIKKPFTFKKITNKVNDHILNSSKLDIEKYEKRLKELKVWSKISRDYENFRREKLKRKEIKDDYYEFGNVENINWNWYDKKKRKVIVD